jgi:tetraacyldisaccharide 4'-kinase
MKYLRLLLFPFSLIYGLAVIVRNWCYDTELFKSRSFDLPVICIGNLEVGGAGKSPMAEYIIDLLKTKYKPATLSRGYGRQTKGFIVADENATATQVGDEPAQFKHKFPGITVAVCEERAVGIEKLRDGHDVIILDDAYQHRAVKAGLNILLFDHKQLFAPHLLLPAGNLREPFSGKWRADIVVVTKCPADITYDQQVACYDRIQPLSTQPLFFTAITYQPLKDMAGKPVDVAIDADATVFLLTGIANARPLVKHLDNLKATVIHHNYPDHHQFSLKNISKLAHDFEACTSSKKIIVTTEKDAQRLREQTLQNAVSELPVLVLPIGVQFLDNGRQNFEDLVNKYVREDRAHR